MRSGPSSPPRRRPPAEHDRRGCRDDARDGSRPGRRAHVGPHNAVRRPAAPPEGLAKFVFRAVRPIPLRPRGAEGRLAWASRRRSGRGPTCSRVLNRAPWPGPPRGRASKEPRQNQEFWALLLSTAFCGAEGRPPRLSDGAATGKVGGALGAGLLSVPPWRSPDWGPRLGGSEIFGGFLLFIQGLLEWRTPPHNRAHSVAKRTEYWKNPLLAREAYVLPEGASRYHASWWCTHGAPEGANREAQVGDRRGGRHNGVPPQAHTHKNHQRRRFNLRIRAGSDPRSWSHDRVWGAEIGMGRSSGAACRPLWGRTRRASSGRRI